MRIELPVANGLRTDHPVPNLPFVDDSHLPLDDGEAIEAQGRHDYNPGWGRYDYDSGDQRRWGAFTTEQFNLKFAWVVRHDPDFGRTVLLYPDPAGTFMHEVSPREGDPLVYRAGGYWWDGKTWHRPMVVYDHSTEEAVVMPVRDAVSITAADVITTHPGNPDKGKLVDITAFSPGTVSENQWAHDLAYWAAHRPDDGQPLEHCVIDVSATELDRDALLSKSGAARELGLSRSEINDALNTDGGGRAERFPFPQWHTPHTSSRRWSKPVLREWMWERQRAHPEPVVEHLHRGESTPNADALIYTITSAVLWQMQRTYSPGRGHECVLGLPLERMLGWVVTEQPRLAEAVFGDIIRDVRNKLDIPDETIARTLREAVQWGLRGEDDDDAIEEFLRRTLPPSMSQ